MSSAFALIRWSTAMGMRRLDTSTVSTLRTCCPVLWMHMDARHQGKHRQYAGMAGDTRPTWTAADKSIPQSFGLGGLTMQSRALSTSAPMHKEADYNNEDAPPKPVAPSPVVYTGLLSASVIRVKMLSVASCLLTTVGSPVIVGLSRPDLAFGMQVATACSLATFGIFTTDQNAVSMGPARYILLGPHAFTWYHGFEYYPVCTDRTRRAIQLTWLPVLWIEVERLNFLAQRTIDTISVEDVKPPQSLKPLSTFSVNGRVYYFDQDHWPDDASTDLLKEILQNAGETVDEEVEE